MSVEAQIKELDESFQQAKAFDVAVTATLEFGAAKQRAFALLNGDPSLRDLFPSRWYASDKTAPTDDLVEALGAALGRLDRRSSKVASDLATVRDLIARAERVTRAAEGKRAAKREALEVLSTRYSELYSKHITLLRQIVRTEHAPSAALLAALREAQAQPLGGADAELNRLMAALLPFEEKRKIKQAIGAFLARGETDLRARQWIRVDHAPMAELLDILRGLETGLDLEADAARRAKRRDEIRGLIATLRERKRMKTDRDALVERARRIKRELKDAHEQTRRFVAALTATLDRHEQQLAAAQLEVEAAERAVWKETLALEAAQGDLKVVQACMDACGQELGFDPTGPKTFDQHLSGLQAEETAAIAAVEAADTAAKRARDAYRDALFQADPRPKDELDALRLAREQRDEEHLDARVRARLATVAKDVQTQIGTHSRSPEDALVEVRRQLEREFPELQRKLALGQAAKDRAEQTSRDAQKARAEIEIQSQTALRSQEFYLRELEQIDAALVRYQQLKKSYAENKVLVYYIGAGQNVFQHLLAVARLLRGRKDSVDSMGRVRVAFVIDAGVRAGFDLGFVGLFAKVGAALLLEGELGIIDSREVMFQSHLKVAFFAEATASARLSTSDAGGLADALPFQSALPTPELLLEASARCEASLYDARACTLYEHERHWAACWADAIARRLAFLRAVQLVEGGFNRINDAWFEEKLAELRRTGGDFLAFVDEIGDAAAKPPRVVDLALPLGVRAEATVAAGSHSKTASTELDAAEFTVQPRWSPGAVWSVREHAVTFEPKKEETTERAPVGVPAAASNFLGTSVFHRVEGCGGGPPGTAQPRDYLEVTLMDGHALNAGILRLTSAATQLAPLAPGEQAQQRYARLARALEATPRDDFKRLVRLPEALKESFPDEAGWRTLARTVRLRLDLVAAGGVPAKTTRLLNEGVSLEHELEERLDAIQEKSKSVRETTQKLEDGLASGVARVQAQAPIGSATVGALGASVQALVAQLRAPVDAASEAVGGLAGALKDELHERMTALQECVTLLENSHTVYARWIRSWVCEAPASGATLTWKPQWVPQLHRGLCLRRFNLALETSFTVAPALAVFLGFNFTVESISSEFEVLGLHTFSYVKGLAGAMREPTWKKWWELHQGELEELCRQVSVPGSVAFSEVARDALFATGPLKAAARRFGEACWDAHRPDVNPFAEGQGSLEERLCRALRGETDGKPRNPFVVGLLCGGDPTLSTTYLEAVRGSLQDPVTGRSSPAFGGVIRLASLRLTDDLQALALYKENELKGLNEAGFDRSSLQERRHLQTHQEAFARRDACERTISSRAERLGPVADTRAALRERASALLELISEDVRSLLELEHALRAELEPGDLPPVTIKDLLPDDPERKVELGSFERAGLAALEAAVRRASTVPPLARWTQASRVSFMIRSDDTRELDTAVAKYHAEVERSTQLVARLGNPSAAGSANPGALQIRSTAVEALLEAVRRWMRGRDLAASKRFPKVALLLLIPAVEERRRLFSTLLASYVRAELVDRTRQGLELRDALAKARGRNLLVRSRFQAAVGRLGRKGRLWQELLAYATAGAPDFAFDALVHGTKQVVLKGPTADVKQVTEPVHKKAS